MAVTEVTIEKASPSATLSRRYTDESVSEVFQVYLNAPSRDFPTILAQAQTGSFTARIPLRGEAWPANPSYGLFADNYQFQSVNNRGTFWKITVNYVPLQPGESNNGQSLDFSNPLFVPRTYRWEYLEGEEPIAEARNVEAMLGVYTRAALTLGPVVNSVGQEVDEPMMRHKRTSVLVVRWNVATLDDILAIENTYADTTNSDTIGVYGARRMEYLGIEDGDEQVSNGIAYRPVVARIALHKTTDRKMNNVGWKHSDLGGNIVTAKVLDEDTGQMVQASEPVFLTVDFGLKSDEATSLTWRYLEEVPYAPLIYG